jgi:hypothetical protein
MASAMTACEAVVSSGVCRSTIAVFDPATTGTLSLILTMESTCRALSAALSAVTSDMSKASMGLRCDPMTMRSSNEDERAW